MYLYTKNLETKRKNKKLNHKRTSLFIIKVKKNNINYKLKLLKRIRIYLIFYILLLESANLNILTMIYTLSELVKHKRYKVENIKGHDLKTQQYIIK